MDFIKQIFGVAPGWGDGTTEMRYIAVCACRRAYDGRLPLASSTCRGAMPPGSFVEIASGGAG
ncbi:hypothetical protein [Mesorhizobium sp.]|uniref:hypothetical protein n=1 Tax=Mesorhizobium sp. TaxID=1871066 RepID=UPI001225CE0F|nr:hypothetical protein [Mesorhizobium sp.]TIN16150.1 MAG: hypothetical protein E5Y51_15485 [Mesorhizobium sp.]